MRAIIRERRRELHSARFWRASRVGRAGTLTGGPLYDRGVFHVVLYQPEIPPNTGNVIRLCANVGATLHLIHPLGFELDEPRVRRAGLDYRELACVREHASLAACLAMLEGARLFAITTRGTRSVYAERFAGGDAFVFGP